jgi:hypothetical protein
MNIKNLATDITELIEKHHKLYRFPVKAELWEDIWDQTINGWDSNWNGGSHSSGADVIFEDKDEIRFQNKSGAINLDKNTVRWNGHRTGKHKTIQDKIDFISQNLYDKYVMLGRNKKEWDSGIKRYYLLMFNSDKIDYTKLDWKEIFNKDNKITGWNGTSSDVPYTAKISKSMSDQLWTESDIDYLGKLYTIDIGS